MAKGGLRGDFTKLRTLMARAERAKAKVGKVRAVLAEVARSEVMRCFRESRDPYGKAWQPLKYRDGMPLLDTGRLRNSITSRQSGTAIIVETVVVYARIHNEGGTIRVGTHARATLAGRFASSDDVGKVKARQAAAASKGKRYRGKALGSASIGAHVITIPERRFIPKAHNLGPYWREAFKNTLTREVLAQLRGP